MVSASSNRTVLVTGANNGIGAAIVRAFARRYRARGAHFGRIINISTDAARAFGTQIGYGASKLALEALTRSVACEAQRSAATPYDAWYHDGNIPPHL